MKVKIKNTTYTMSEGKTRDILDLAVWAQKKLKENQDDIKASFIAIAQSILIGLRATYFNFKWYQILNKLKYRKFLNDYSVQYILENTDYAEMTRINEENSKKKVVAKENQ